MHRLIREPISASNSDAHHALVFVGVLVEPDTIEIADFEVDPDYWEMIENDPND